MLIAELQVELFNRKAFAFFFLHSCNTCCVDIWAFIFSVIAEVALHIIFLARKESGFSCESS